MADGLSKKLPSWTSDIEWPTAIPEKDRLRLKPEPVLESYLPTSRDRLLYALARFYGGDAKGEKGSARANETMNFLDWTPVGALNDSYDVGRMIGEGQFGNAALAETLAILPGHSEYLVKKIRQGLPGESLFGFRSKPKSHLTQGNPDGITHKAEDYEIYNPPDKPQRPFNSDYSNPANAVSDASGKLLKDRDGRDLTAKNVIGRQTVGGPDVGATPEIVESVAEDISGNKISTVPRQTIDDAHGISWFDPKSGKPEKIEIADDLPQPQKDMVIAHEAAHFIEETAGQIPTNGLDNELRFIYNTTATGKENVHPIIGPEKMGYTGDDIQRELMTEAVRTYMANPNWIKTMAPRTAARIREWVNTHPELSKLIQFNSVAAGAGGLFLGEQSKESEAREMPREKHHQQSNMLKGPYSIFGPPIPFEFVNEATRAGSYGLRQIADALIRRGIVPPTRSNGEFRSLARALMDVQTRQKGPVYGGPR